MSAFIATCFTDRVELLTDGAFYADDGTLLEIASKVYPATSKPFVVTGRGATHVVCGFAAWINSIADAAPTVDDAISELASSLKSLRDGKDGVAREAKSHAEMVIACMSEGLGPIIYYLSTGDFYEKLEPWVLHCSQDLGGGPMPSMDEIAKIEGMSDTHKDGLAKVGVPIFELMRAMKGPNPTNPAKPEIYGIGGMVELTKVSAEGVTTQTLKTWPDQVGQKIEPFPAEAANWSR